MSFVLNPTEQPMNIEIRKASLVDSLRIAQFQVNMAKETESKDLDITIVQRAVEKVFDDRSKGFYVVASHCDNVVGSLMITYEWSDWRDTNMWYIQSVFIEREFRGRKIFSQMFDFVKRLAESDDVKVIRLYVEQENERAQKVYEKLGMKRMPYFMYDITL